MTDARGHLDLDELADVLAGERDDAHLRSCRSCADRLDELSAADATTAAALAALPAPGLPDGLSARLEQALLQERRRGLAAVRPLRRRPPAWLPAVAASVTLVTVGAVGWAALDQPGPGGQDAATSAGGTGGEVQDTSSAGRAGPESADAAGPESAAGLAVPSTGTDWADESTRSAALARLLEVGTSSSSAGPSGDELDRLRDPAALSACLTGATDGATDGGEVLAVDYAQYAGAPAVAVVRAVAPDLVEVVVVASGCTAEDPQVLTEVRLPRP